MRGGEKHGNQFLLGTILLVGFFVLLVSSPAEASQEASHFFSSPRSFLHEIGKKFSWDENPLRSFAADESRVYVYTKSTVQPPQSSPNTFLDRSRFSHAVAAVFGSVSDFFRNAKERWKSAFEDETIITPGNTAEEHAASSNALMELYPEAGTLSEEPLFLLSSRMSRVEQGLADVVHLSPIVPSSLTISGIAGEEIDSVMTRLDGMEQRIDALESRAMRTGESSASVASSSPPCHSGAPCIEGFDSRILALETLLAPFSLSSSTLSLPDSLTVAKLLTASSFRLSNLTNCEGGSVLETNSEGFITCGLDNTSSSRVGSEGVEGSLQFKEGGGFEGSSNLIWDPLNNRLGIGTSSPGRALSVQGDILASGNLVTAGQTIGGDFSVTGNTIFGDAQGDTLTITAGTIAHSAASTTTIPELVGVWSIATSTAVGQNPIFSIDGLNGRVGIGTNNPSLTLHVTGPNGRYIGVETTDSTTGSLAELRSTADTPIVSVVTHASERTVSRFGLTLGGWGEVLLSSNSATTTLPNGLIVGTRQATPVVFGTNNVERMRIISDGSVGIATTTPGARLAVNGPAFFDSKLIRFASSSASQLTLAYQAAATSTLVDSVSNAFGFATSTNAKPIFSISTIKGQALVKDGTVGAPGLTFNGNTAVGFWRSGTSVRLGGGTGGVARIAFESANGIQLSSGSWLGWASDSSLTGAVTLDTILSRDAANTISMENSTNAQEFRIYNTDSTDDEFASLGFINNSNVFSIQTEATGSATVRPIALLGGNVGIGTTTPGAKLALDGTAFFDSKLIRFASSSASQLTLAYQARATSTIPQLVGAFTIATSTNAGIKPIFSVDGSSARVTIQNSGSSSQLPLRIKGYGKFLDVGFANDSYARFDTDASVGFFFVDDVVIGSLNTFFDSTPGSNSYINYSGGGGLAIGKDTSADFPLEIAASSSVGYFGISSLAAGTSDGNLFLVDENGNVGISTTTPWGKLSVEMDTNTRAFVVGDTGSSSPAFIVKGNNKTGIGTSSPWRTFSLTGTAGFSSSLSSESGTDNYLCIDGTTYEITNGGADCGASSLRYKENIEDLTYSLDTILQLKPVSFQWKESEHPNDRTRKLGFIAEDMHLTLPEIVSYTASGSPESIDYNKLTAVLTKGIQEIATIAGTFKQNLIAWLGDAANGIGELFAKRIRSEQVKTEELCVGNTCLTESELQRLLSNDNNYNNDMDFGSESGMTSDEEDTEPPTIELLGNDPAEVPVDSTFADPGVTVHDNVTEDFYIRVETNILGHRMFKDLEEEITEIDTSEAGNYVITYTATDLAGNSSTKERTVVVGILQDVDDSLHEEEVVSDTAEEDVELAPEAPVDGASPASESSAS